MSVMTTIADRFKKSSTFDWLYLSMFLLTIAGLGVSAYLMWGYTVPGASLACGSSHGCDTVKNSPYSSLAGIPLPIMGLISYAALIILLVLQNQAIIARNGRSAYVALAIFGLSLIGVLYSVYLTYLELYVIYAICRWCVASATIMVVIFLLSIFNLRNSNQSNIIEG